MNLLEQIQVLRRIDTLVKRKATGTPEQLAHRLGVSKNSVFRYIKELKSMGAPIVYCRSRQTYFYERDFLLKF